MTRPASFEQAMELIWVRSGYDRGFISNPFAGDDAARLGLIRTARTLALLGNPERDYPIVHVAGSKGKGSTCSFIDSILRCAGVRTGRFLSPHLHSYRERFVVDDEPIDDDAFTALAGDVFDAALEAETADTEIGQLTAWELSTAMALLWFSRSGCEMGVIEVGMGGTLDATNVVSPSVAVITRLDFEHTAILGETMAEIAGNKAGIVKPGIPVVCADQPPDGLRVIEQRAAALDSPLLVANRDWFTTGTDESFSVTGPTWRHTDLHSSLAGQHQVQNAGLAIAAVHMLERAPVLKLNLAGNEIRNGLAHTFVPGRFEVVSDDRGNQFVLDGAHTPESMRALADTIRARFPEHEVTVVVGMLNDKNPEFVLAPLVEISDRWIVAPAHNPRAMSTAELLASLARLGVEATPRTTVTAALETATASALATAASQVVLITGSFSTVAEARVALGVA